MTPPSTRKILKKGYRIPSDVTIEHCHLGEWHEKRSSKVVVIPMVVFIEGGMRIPMGRVTRDFLYLFRLVPLSVPLICLGY